MWQFLLQTSHLMQLDSFLTEKVILVILTKISALAYAKRPLKDPHISSVIRTTERWHHVIFWLISSKHLLQSTWSFDARLCTWSKKTNVYRSFFLESSFIMACFGWMLLDPFFLITQKRIVQPSKITVSQTQMPRTPWVSATLRLYPKLQRAMW